MNVSRETRVDWPVVDGVRLRCVSWRGDGKRRGTVVICMGRTEFVEKYAGVVQRLLGLGLDVVAFDWRGQGLSDRLLDDRAKGHVGRYEDYLADLDRVTALVSDRKFPEPRIMLAHSMGGQVGIRFLHDRPDYFAGAAMTAPMFGILLKGLPSWLAGLLVETLCLIGWTERYAFGQGPRSYVHGPFEGNVLTSSERNFLELRALLDADPELAVGGPTFGWVRESLRSAATLRQPVFLESIDRPVLIALAGQEAVVDNGAIEEVASRLPRGELVRIAEARHEILIERADLQQVFWDAFDAWLSRLPTGATPPCR